MAWRGRRYNRSGRGFGAAGRGGHGYWARTTGMPGWMRAAQGLPAYGGRGRGNPYPYCRFFPWLPRGWWSGMYGPVQRSPQGPTLSTQTQPTTTGQFPPTPMTGFPSQQMGQIPSTPANESTLQQQKQMLEQQLERIKGALKELEESK